MMLAVFLEAAKDPKEPLVKLNMEMKWGISFSGQEIQELEKLMSIMGPMNKLFSQLNAEKESTIHLVYPTVKVNFRTTWLPF